MSRSWYGRPMRAGLFLTALAVAQVARGAHAQSPARQAAARNGLPPIIPIEHFFDNPVVTGAQISPDGRYVSYLKPYKGKLNIFVRPAAGTAERRMTADTVRPVVSYFWSADGKYLLYVQDKGGNENYRVYAVPVGASGTPVARDLTPFENVRAQIFAVPRRMPEKILVGLNRRTPSAFDAYWLTIASGELTMAAENPGRHLAYFIDADHKVRAATGQSEKGETQILARATESDAWRLVGSYPATDNVTPLRIHPDKKRLYMSSNAGDTTDLAALVLLDLESGQTSVVESDPERQADFGNMLYSAKDEQILATVYVGDTVRIYPKTPQMQKDLAAIRRLHDGEPNFTSTTLDESKVIVAFDSPTDPGATYLYDRATGTARFLFRPRPWLKGSQLASVKPVSYKAADGLTIHGYLTAPRGVAARNLPLVLLVHGGPWARDEWGYQPEAQLLANRGYAVLQINYRGSTGYGKKFYNAAVKEWAGKMHTDLTDGVKWAVAEGIANAQRVGIYGGSYGGYATLVGLTFTPELFACGVSYVGPSSLITLIQSFPPYWRPFLEGTFYRHIGDPAKEADREDMKKRSPLFFVDRIQDPLLIIQGANDPRVTKREADQMAIALRDRGVKVQYLLAPNEGHGFLNPENRLAAYRAMEQFFGGCLGGRVQQTVPARITRKIAELTLRVDTLKLAEEPKGGEPVEIKVGDPTLKGTALAPERTVWRMVLVQEGREREVGTATDELAAIVVDGQPALRRVQVVGSAATGVNADTVTFVHATLAPISHRGSGPRRKLSLDFNPSGVTGTRTPTEGAPEPVDFKSDVPLFDVNTLDLALRVLPLSEGYAVKFSGYLLEAGGKVTVTSRVIKSEPVDVKGKMIESWVVENDVAGRKVTHWIAKDTRAIVRTSLSPAPGVELRLVP